MNKVTPEERGQLQGGIGERIRERRQAMQLSMRELARECGLSLSFVCDLENGKRAPGAAALWRLSDVLGVTIDWLVKGGAS